jgi:hypothetical protein
VAVRPKEVGIRSWTLERPSKAEFMRTSVESKTFLACEANASSMEWTVNIRLWKQPGGTSSLVKILS